MRHVLGASLVFLSLIGTANAGTITAAGAVIALTNVTQMKGILGNGNFDEGPTSGAVPLNVYSAQGLTWQTGVLSTILPGCPNTGSAGTGPQYGTWNYFPGPIGGGGVHGGQSNNFAGVATFSVTVTQVGVTAGTNGQQWLTVWGTNGAYIGQVSWTPANDASFVGIDTQGVPIAMVAYGNHDLFSANTPYNLGGTTNISDSWIWASGGGCTSAAQCNSNNPCITDSCNGGVCAHTNNNAPCSLGACVESPTCLGGVCQGGTPMACPPPDQCHTAGVCNPTDGTCSNPVKVNGTACTDSNLCDETHTCMAGVCTDSNPMPCAPTDQCHTVGTCDMATGACTSPAVADGTACDDGNACTSADVCTAGVCGGTTKVTCTAMDACHAVGMCDTTTGMCTNPALPDGASCDDGDKCTSGKTCTAGACGGTKVTCTAADDCHTAGTCDPTTGCSNPEAPDGTACTGGTCKSGTCTPSSSGTGGAGGSSGTGGISTGVVGPPQPSSCSCGVAGSAGGATPAAALLMILALRRRRRDAVRSL